jgi:hypothetical protein
MEKHFKFGDIYITTNAQRALSHEIVNSALVRHISGDWGDVSRMDWRRNDRALEEGTRIFSSYHDPKGRKFWIITEADRSMTTVLLPEDY